MRRCLVQFCSVDIGQLQHMIKFHLIKWNWPKTYPAVQVRNFVDTYFDLAVYDPPTKLTGRRNEVIFEAGSGLIPDSTNVDNPFASIPTSLLAHLRALYAELFH